MINLRCYICAQKGHIATKCPFFNRKKGNLVAAFKKLKKQNFKEDIEDFLGMDSSVTCSYIYEEDDPERNRTTKLGELILDKPI